MAVQAGSREANAQGKKKDQEWWEQWTWLQALDQQRRYIDELINRYNEMADWHHEQAEIARRNMREAGDKLAAIDDFLSGAKDVLERYERTGKVDREKAMELLRARGVAVDPTTNDARLALLLAKQQAAARRERAAWSKQYEQSKTEATTQEEMELECRKKAEELVQKRDDIRNHGYDAGEESLRLKQVTEEYERSVQDQAADIEKVKPKDLSNELATLRHDTLNGHVAKQMGSEGSDFEALATGALSGEFAKAAKGTEVTPMTPPPAPPTGSPPSANRSIG
jgi:hypothetical protein